MPQLTWPWALGLSLALLAAFLLANEWLKKQRRNEFKPRPRHSASTSANVSLRPTLPQKVVTQVDPENRPPWEIQEMLSDGSNSGWPPSSRKRSKEQIFEAELDEAFLTAPLATRHDPAPLHHNDLDQWWREETPSMMRLPMDGYTMPVSSFQPRGMSLECRVKPDLTIPAGQINWTMPTVTPPQIRMIRRIEHMELVLY